MERASSSSSTKRERIGKGEEDGGRGGKGGSAITSTTSDPKRKEAAREREKREEKEKKETKAENSREPKEKKETKAAKEETPATAVVAAATPTRSFKISDIDNTTGSAIGSSSSSSSASSEVTTGGGSKPNLGSKGSNGSTKELDPEELDKIAKFDRYGFPKRDERYRFYNGLIN
jgi:outer membrane biosynthesis protein TonB